MNSLPHRIGRRLATVVMGMAILLASCTTSRPMPTHGGGKRFDEEQRLVSATIQHAAEKMDFARLRMSRVAIEVTSLPTSGSAADVQYGRLDDIYDYQINPKLITKKNITRQDVEYLEKALVRRLRYDGYQVTSPKDADIYLVVLVDSLGTNHHRKDFGLFFKDALAVSCEMTYYAINAKTQKMISSARSVASIGDYFEVNVRFSPISFNARDVDDFNETIVPLPSVQSCATGAYGDAHVDALQFKPPPPFRKKGKGGKGIRGKAPKLKLPTGRGGNGPDNELLPQPPGDENDTGAGDQKEEIKKLVNKGYKAAKEKDAAELQKIINEIKVLKPGAPVIQKLQVRLDALKKGAYFDSREFLRPVLPITQTYTGYNWRKAHSWRIAQNDLSNQSK